MRSTRPGSYLDESIGTRLVRKPSVEGFRRRKDVSVYFTHYSARTDLKVAPGLAEGRPAVLVSDAADPSGAVRYVVVLDWSNERISRIRDFHYVRYVTDGLVVTRL